MLSTDKETSSPFNFGLAVGLSVGILSLVTCPVIGTLWYKKSRRSKKVNVSSFHTRACVTKTTGSMKYYHILNLFLRG